MQLQCHWHPLTMPNNSSPSGYCLNINSCGNHSRTRTDTSNQVQAFPHTSFTISIAIVAPLPSIDNAKQFLTIRLLPQHQFLWKLLDNLQRYNQSSVSLPSHIHPKVHIDQTLPFWMQLRRPCHPLTMPNNSSPSGYYLHINCCRNCSRTCADTSNQAQAFPRTS